MKRSRTKVLSVRILPWPYFRTKRMADLLGKSLSLLTMEALSIYFSRTQNAGIITKKTLDIWLKEYHKEFPNEMD